jgi:hypothetical protein
VSATHVATPFKIKTEAGQADLETQALATEAGVQIETINFIKLKGS